MKAPRPFRQDLFDYFAENHGLTLLESEMVDIERIVLRTAIESEWVYQYGEIEAALGGEVALAVRKAVLERRAAIDHFRTAG